MTAWCHFVFIFFYHIWWIGSRKWLYLTWCWRWTQNLHVLLFYFFKYTCIRILPDLIQTTSNYLVHVLTNEVTATYLKKKRKKKQRKNIEEFGPDIENFRFAKLFWTYSDVIYFKVTIVGSVYPKFFFCTEWCGIWRNYYDGKIFIMYTFKHFGKSDCKWFYCPRINQQQNYM